VNCTDATYIFVYSISKDYEFVYTTSDDYIHELETSSGYNFCVDKDDIGVGIGVWIIGSTFTVQ